MSVGRSRRTGPQILVVVLAAACILTLAACDVGSPSGGPSSATPDTNATEAAVLSEMLTQLPVQPTPSVALPPGDLDDEDRVSIYLNVINDLLGEKVPSNIYISPYLGRGERLDEPDDSLPVPADLLETLNKEDTGPTYEATDFRDAIGPLEDGGAVKNNGAFITLGVVTGDPVDKDAAVVRGSIYRKEGDAHGDRFQLKRDASAPHGWKILDTTQEWTE